MATYFSLDRGYWTDPDFEKCPPLGRLLYLYLGSSRHCNLLGLYSISDHRIMDETGLNKAQLAAATKALVGLGKIEAYPPKYWIKAYLGRQKNLDQDLFFKGVVNELLQMPAGSPLVKSFVGRYAPLLRRQTTGKRYGDSDRTALLAFLDQNEAPTKEQPRGNHAPSLVHNDNDNDSYLGSSPESKEEGSIASPVPTSPNMEAEVTRVLEYLNEKAGRRFLVKTESSRSFVRARLEDYTLEDCLDVIDKKVAEWKGDAKMDRYLRPETLFNAAKFEAYHNQKAPATLKTKPGPGGIDMAANIAVLNSARMKGKRQ